MTSRRGLGQMLIGGTSALFFTLPAIMNMLVVTGYLEATPAVKVISVFGSMACFVAVVVAVLIAWDGWKTWCDWNHW